MSVGWNLKKSLDHLDYLNLNPGSGYLRRTVGLVGRGSELSAGATSTSIEGGGGRATRLSCEGTRLSREEQVGLRDCDEGPFGLRLHSRASRAKPLKGKSWTW